MPITFVSSDAESRGANTTAITLAGPSTAQANDIAVVFGVRDDDTGAFTMDGTYTQLQNNSTIAGRDLSTAIWVKRLGASESNPSFNVTVAQEHSASIHIFRGVDTAIPLTSLQVSFVSDDNINNPNEQVPASISNVPSEACGIRLMGVTHDDITSVGTPTGFTAGESITGSVQDFRQQTVAYDLDLGATGTKTPTTFSHTTNNTVAEYHSYFLILPLDLPVKVSNFNTTGNFSWGQTGVTITGTGFGATQGAGKIEFWSDAMGTIKTVQTIDTWANTSIVLDTIQGALPNNTFIFLVVTTNGADENSPFSVTVGLLPYSSIIADLSPDHYWAFSNNYNDAGVTGPARNFTGGVVGTWTFSNTPIRDGNSHSLNMNSATNRRELNADSPNMNITVNAQERTLCCWIQTNIIQKSLGAWFKEGGGVQNLAFLMGYGNVLLAQMADTASKAGNVQAWSDIKLNTSRPYHICMRYDFPNNFELFLDGRLQSNTAGNPLGVDTFDSHSGDVVIGNPDTNLETGGTDISYLGINDGQMSDFLTWSDNSAYSSNSGGALLDTDILTLFQRGAVPDEIIVSGTESVMQTALDAFADTTRPDWPLAFRIEAPTGSINITLRMDNITFDDRITEHVEWRGPGILTILSRNGTNLDASRTFAPGGGSITVVNDSVLSFSNVVDGTEIRIFDSSTGNLIDFVESNTGGTFSSSISPSLSSSVDIRVVALGYVVEEFYSVDITSGNVSIPLSAKIDRTYVNP